jgi:hypothetical protein
MKTVAIVAIWIMTAATTASCAAPAAADTVYQFQSPSEDIACSTDTHGDGTGSATCEVAGDSAGPPLPCPLPPTSHVHFELDQGHAPDTGCGYTLFVPGLSILDYGQTRSAGAITCDSEPSGMTCTDSGTTHFFHVSHESYQLG